MSVDIGLAEGVQAQSFGQPGHRTFRLTVVGDSKQSASLWMEKEHLAALSLALRQVIAELKFDEQPAHGDLAPFPDVAEHDFRVGRIGIGFDNSSRTVIVQVDEVGKEEHELRFRLKLGFCSLLVSQMEEIIAAGRPTCPLCSLPMDPEGHVCIRSNGHRDEPIPDAESESDE